MTNLNAFRTHPSFIGFDSLFRQLENSVDRSTNYPPYNIILEEDENKFRIEMAVAGFSNSEIDIQLENQVLTIHGEPLQKEGMSYVHKGISSRKFKQSFNLAQYVEVESAALVNGILTIYLERRIPDEKKPRKIAISSPQLLLEE